MLSPSSAAEHSRADPSPGFFSFCGLASLRGSWGERSSCCTGILSALSGPQLSVFAALGKARVSTGLVSPSSTSSDGASAQDQARRCVVWTHLQRCINLAHACTHKHRHTHKQSCIYTLTLLLKTMQGCPCLEAGAPNMASSALYPLPSVDLLKPSALPGLPLCAPRTESHMQVPQSHIVSDVCVFVHLSRKLLFISQNSAQNALLGGLLASREAQFIVRSPTPAESCHSPVGPLDNN